MVSQGRQIVKDVCCGKIPDSNLIVHWPFFYLIVIHWYMYCLAVEIVIDNYLNFK